ncbi:MAG TPA: TVP38/TMEM64 family protein [Gammaproteobacteria bacterium]
MKAGYRAALLLVLVAALLAAAAMLPVGDWLARGVDWIAGHGPVAWSVYVGIYVLAAVLVVPGSILTLAAGFVFGLPLGVALVSLGSVLGAACAFLVGRFLARDWVAQRIAGLPRFHALDLATRREGFVIVLLARLSPLFPYNLLNYGLGVTGVRFRDYVVATWIGMLPATVLYVYVGTLAQNLTELTAGARNGGWTTWALLALGFAATVLLTVVVTRKANSALKAHLRESEAPAAVEEGPG